jgi:hypothetical protein
LLLAVTRLEVTLFTTSLASMKSFFETSEARLEGEGKFTVRLVPEPLAEEAEGAFCYSRVLH